jgi:hypothetical protein
VIPGNFESFFAAMAGAAAALIGLLFVAISVAPHRLVEAETRVESQTLAGSALLAFSNVLVFSTVALIPDLTIGWLAIALGAGGLAFAASQGRALLAEHHHGPRSALLVVGLIVVCGWEAVEGVLVEIDPHHDTSAISTIAGLLVGSLAVGIGRAWRLVGMRDTGLGSSLSRLLRGEQSSESSGE